MSNKKPNIVFIFPDQMRADFLGCYGADFIKTPNIDKLAENGIRYQNAYSSSPVCVPARTNLMTGMDAISNGVASNAPAHRPDHQAAGINTWPEILKEMEYYTAGIGKMHFYPWDRKNGFMYRSVTEDKRWLNVRDDYFHHLRESGLKKFHGNEHDGYHENFGAVVSKLPWKHSWDHFVGTEACKFIDEYGEERPFAMMVGFPGPHDPYDPSDDFSESIPDINKMPEPIKGNPHDASKLKKGMIEGWKRPWADLDYEGLTKEKIMKMRSHYAALIQQIDHEVGEIVKTLKKKNLFDNTIIIFSSDHGDFLGDHGMMGKANFFESAMRVPLIVSGNSLPNNRVENGLVCLRDITSTILSFAGAEIPFYMDSRPLPGTGFSDNQGRENIIGMLTSGWMAFDGRWKLMKYSTGESLLFDLENDPFEENNLINDFNFVKELNRLDDILMKQVLFSRQTSMHAFTAGGVSLTTEPVNPVIFGYQFEGWEWEYPTHIDTKVTRGFFEGEQSVK